MVIDSSNLKLIKFGNFKNHNGYEKPTQKYLKKMQSMLFVSRIERMIYYSNSILVSVYLFLSIDRLAFN